MDPAVRLTAIDVVCADRDDEFVVAQWQVSRNAEGGLADHPPVDRTIRVPVVHLPGQVVVAVLTDDSQSHWRTGRHMDVDPTLLPRTQDDTGLHDASPVVITHPLRRRTCTLRGGCVDAELGEDGNDGLLTDLCVSSLPVVELCRDAESIGEFTERGI